jgi:lysophospholipase L1-like esterase
MILTHAGIEFHNAAALEPLCGMPGLVPVRLPRAVRDGLNFQARFVASGSAGVELRFITSAPRFRIALAAHTEAVNVHVYRGEFGHSDHRLESGRVTVLHLIPPERFPLVPRECLERGAFSPDLWRVQISDAAVSFLGIETFGAEIRPPRAEEKPKLRWLAYGSSITQSWAKGYPIQAARRLGVDLLNKGLSGSCYCEEILAEHLATGETWDFATLELGVNMRGVFSPEEFESRVRHLVGRLRKARPRAPLVVITHFLNLQHFPLPGHGGIAAEHQNAYDAILRTLAAELMDDGVHLIEGCDLLTDFTGLSCDLLHPSDFGHIQMGENLARRLLPLLREAKLLA